MTARLRTILLLAMLLFAVPAAAQRQCVKGKPCGGTCIARNRTCHVAPSPAPQARPAPRDTTRSPAPRDSTSRPAVSTGPWVASSRGTTYYRAGCAGAKNLAVANRIYFTTEQDAVSAGYRRSRQAGC